MACGIQLYFWVSCLAITAEHLVLSLLYMFYTAATSDEISILACEGEAHLAAFTEQDEKFYGFALELSGTLTVMAEVLMWTLGVKIIWILALCC